MGAAQSQTWPCGKMELKSKWSIETEINARIAANPRHSSFATAIWTPQLNKPTAIKYEHHHISFCVAIY